MNGGAARRSFAHKIAQVRLAENPEIGLAQNPEVRLEMTTAASAYSAAE